MAIPATQKQTESPRALAPSEFLKELSAELAGGPQTLTPDSLCRAPSFGGRVRRPMPKTKQTSNKMLQSAGNKLIIKDFFSKFSRPLHPAMIAPRFLIIRRKEVYDTAKERQD